MSIFLSEPISSFYYNYSACNSGLNYYSSLQKNLQLICFQHPQYINWCCKNYLFPNTSVSLINSIFNSSYFCFSTFLRQNFAINRLYKFCRKEKHLISAAFQKYGQAKKKQVVQIDIFHYSSRILTGII